MWQAQKVLINFADNNTQDMAKGYFQRYVWLLNTIRQRGYATLAQIQDLWQYSALNETGEKLAERTFHHHREAILDTFGIEIKFDKSQGYYICNEDMKDGGFKNWLLTSLSVNNMINESSSLRDRIVLEDIPSGQEYLETIIAAMKEDKMVQMEYQDFKDSEKVSILFAPYCIKLFKQRWYLVGRHSNKGELTIYALDRIQKLEPTQKAFKLSAKFDASSYFSDWFGIVHDQKYYHPETIRLKVWAKQGHYFRTLPLHPSQQEVEKHEDWSIFEYFMAPTWDLEMDLLRYNDNVEVLEPQSLRDAMEEHILNMKELYNI